VPSTTEITVSQLSRLIGLPHLPAIVDVRADEEFASRPTLIPGSKRHAAGANVSWGGEYAGQPVIVVCKDGLHLSQGVGALLKAISGKWSVEDVPGGARNGRALAQRATDNEYNVIVAPGGPYRAVDVSVRFKPISGSEDASGGIVLRFAAGRYYVVRANALEDNFRFYYYDGGRHMLASANVAAPVLDQWHKLQITARGDRFQARLNERELIDHRDDRFTVGRIGLWTKTDSVTAFDSLTVLPLNAE